MIRKWMVAAALFASAACAVEEPEAREAKIVMDDEPDNHDPDRSPGDAERPGMRGRPCDYSTDCASGLACEEVTRVCVDETRAVEPSAVEPTDDNKRAWMMSSEANVARPITR